MKATGNDHQIGIGRPVHQPVSFVDAPRPVAGQVAAQGFRLADSCEWFTCGGGNQQVDSLECFFILILPVQIIFPSIGNESNGTQD